MPTIALEEMSVVPLEKLEIQTILFETFERERLDRETLNGVQTIYRYKNNYGASVIKNTFSESFELVVIKYKNNEDNIEKFDICYDTHISNDIMRGLNMRNVVDILEEIRKLKIVKRC